MVTRRPDLLEAITETQTLVNSGIPGGLRESFSSLMDIGPAGDVGMPVGGGGRSGAQAGLSVMA